MKRPALALCALLLVDWIMNTSRVAEVDKYCREHDLVTEVSRSGLDNSVVDAWCAPKAGAK